MAPGSTLKCTIFYKPLMVNKLLPDHGCSECGGAVATGAITAEFASVHVILAMAGDASCGQAGIGHVLFDVAVIASQLCVSPGEREARITAMVERHLSPADG